MYIFCCSVSLLRFFYGVLCSSLHRVLAEAIDRMWENCQLCCVGSFDSVCSGLVWGLAVGTCRVGSSLLAKRGGLLLAESVLRLPLASVA